MLHKLEMPAYRPQLEAILDFQQHLLAFACTAPSLPLNVTMLRAQFGEQKGEWLSRRCWTGTTKTKFSQELENLINYVTRNPLEGPAILDAFRNDRDFYKHLNDPDFEFQYPRLSQRAQKAIEPFMVSFYERLFETGFPDCIHLGLNAETFTRKILRKGFYAANPRLRVCPGCDGPPPNLSNETRGVATAEEKEEKKRDYAEIDHFFPKALYPFFSLHFMNLVPLCPICNIKAKRDKDPLNKCMGKGALEHTFLPFIKPAASYIEVTISRNANNLRRVMLRDTQSLSSRRVKNLDTTFELSYNWENHLEHLIVEMLFRIGGPQSRRKGNRQRIEKEMKKTLRDLTKAQEESIGQMPHLLVQRGYAHYALNDQQEIEVLLAQIMDENAPKVR